MGDRDMSRQLTSGVLGRRKTLANEYRMFVLSQGGIVNDISWVEQRYAEAIQAGDIQSDGTPNFDYAMFDYRAGLEVEEVSGLDRVRKIWGLFKIDGVYPVMGTDVPSYRGILTNDGIWFDSTDASHSFDYFIPKNYGKESFEIEQDFNFDAAANPHRYTRTGSISSGYFSAFQENNTIRNFLLNNTDTFITGPTSSALPTGRSHNVLWKFIRDSDNLNLQVISGGDTYQDINNASFDTIFSNITGSRLFIGRPMTTANNANNRTRMISIKYPEI